jgi:hypothetical protein
MLLAANAAARRMPGLGAVRNAGVDAAEVFDSLAHTPLLDQLMGVVRVGAPLECRQVAREPGRLLLAWDLSARRITKDSIVVAVRDVTEAETLRASLAAAERALAARFNQPGQVIVDHRTYALLGDGCMMEGIVYEAASLAGQHKLDKLTWLYDANDISLDGPTSLSFDVEDVAARFVAQGWHVERVADGDRDLAAIDRALSAARAVLTRNAEIERSPRRGLAGGHRRHLRIRPAGNSLGPPGGFAGRCAAEPAGQRAASRRARGATVRGRRRQGAAGA